MGNMNLRQSSKPWTNSGRTTQLVGNLVQQQAASTNALINAMAARGDQRHAEQQQINANFSEQFQQAANRINQLEQKQQQIQKSLTLANQTAVSREDVQSVRFDRPANLEIIKVSAKMVVTKSAVETALHPFLQEVCGFGNDSWKVVPSTPPGKVFNLKFNFNPLTNAEMVTKTMASLRDDTGAFRKVFCKKPDDSQELIRLDRDENETVES